MLEKLTSLNRKINFVTFLYDMASVTLILVLIVMWIAGIVLAKGVWATVAACIIPFYSWYLIIEAFLVKFGLV